MKTPSKAIVAAMLMIGGVCISIAFWGRVSSADNPGHTKTGFEKQNLASLAAAIRSYQDKLNNEPPASPGKSFASLPGANPKEYTFLSSPKHADTDTEIILDEWCNRYQRLFRDAGWNVRSAGPNRKFDGGESGDDNSVVVPAIQK
jgi:hypothetical protein